MKQLFLLSAFLHLSITAVEAADEIQIDRESTTVILDKTAVANLKIQTELVEERDFESTVFAIGRIEEIPSGRSVVSTRGRPGPSG